MRNWTLAAVAVLVCSLVAAVGTVPASADATNTDERFRQCLDGVLNGFDSGLEERACGSYYDLPSAYHFYCAQRVRTGFKTSLERDACVRFFENEALRAMRAYIRIE